MGEEDDGSNRWVPVDSVAGSEKENRTVAQPRPAQFWNRVEAKASPPVQMEEMAEGSGHQIMVERQVTTEVESSEGKRFSWGRRMSGTKTPSGMKKNVWEVRKK